MQRNLVYVIGLPLSFADENLLKGKDCFGQYGKIIKVVVNKSHVTDRVNPTASAYVTFYRPQAAQRAIDVLDGFVLDGRMLRASFGTTKYCNFFLRNMSCTNPECLYLHALGREEDSFTKEEMQAGKVSFKDTTPGTSGCSGLSFPAPITPPPSSTTRHTKGPQQPPKPTIAPQPSPPSSSSAQPVAASDHQRASFEISIHDPVVKDTSAHVAPIGSPEARQSNTPSAIGLDWTTATSASVDETLANLLGVQLSGDLAAREKANRSRFAFANTAAANSSTPGPGGSPQLAFLQQMLPNVNISVGNDLAPINYASAASSLSNPPSLQYDPAILYSTVEKK